MILDGQLQFSSAQAITAAANSTNSIDVGEARNLGEGKELYVVTIITTTMTDGGSNTGVQVIMYGGATLAATTGQQLLFTIPKGSLAASGPYYAKLSPDFVAATLASNYEFLMLNYNPTGANLTAGAFTSYLTTAIAGFIAYKKNYTIS